MNYLFAFILYIIIMAAIASLMMIIGFVISIIFSLKKNRIKNSIILGISAIAFVTVFGFSFMITNVAIETYRRVDIGLSEDQYAPTINGYEILSTQGVHFIAKEMDLLGNNHEIIVDSIVQLAESDSLVLFQKSNGDLSYFNTISQEILPQDATMTAQFSLTSQEPLAWISQRREDLTFWESIYATLGSFLFAFVSALIAAHYGKKNWQRIKDKIYKRGISEEKNEVIRE